MFAAALTDGGLALFLRPLARRGAAGLLLVLFAAVVVLMHGPQLLAHPGVFASWSGAAEQLALACAAALALTLLSAPGLPRQRLRRPAPLAFGVCLLLFGCAHFIYLGFTAEMVPAWLPGGQSFWPCFTGAAHLLAGLAILSGVGARPAAVLLTVMFATFGFLVHAPLLLREPGSHLDWTVNAINLALTGAAWVLADSLRPRIAPHR
jgi:uncharacterized membrane protein YphA (DoxX/SURF4 family)